LGVSESIPLKPEAFSVILLGHKARDFTNYRETLGTIWACQFGARIIEAVLARWAGKARYQAWHPIRLLRTSSGEQYLVITAYSRSPDGNEHPFS
jgi:hypothetical protein